MSKVKLMFSTFLIILRICECYENIKELCSSDLVINRDLKECKRQDMEIKSDKVTVKNCVLTEDFKEFLEENSKPVILSNVFPQTPNLKRSAILEINFDMCFNVTVLDVSSNHLREVGDIFRYLPELKRLDLSRNEIENLPEIIEQEDLITLHMNGNNIGCLNENIFLKTINLRSLVFDYRRSGEKLLQPLKKLINLSMRVKDKLDIPEEYFENNKALTHLNINGGKVAFKTHRILYELTKLKVFVIRESQIGNLPGGMFNKNSVLSDLTLVEIGLSTLPEGIFQPLQELVNLDLSFNNLSVWESNFYQDGLQKLKTLILSHNKIKTITSGSFSFNSLRSLSLDNNMIWEISPEAFKDTPNLLILKLQKNKLGDSSNIFKGLNELEKIDLSFNNYSSYPHLDKFPHLKEVLLRNNYLKELWLRDIGVGAEGQIRNIDISGNLIEVIHFERIIKHLMEKRSYLHLNIKDNPLREDCRLFNIRKEIGNLKFQFRNQIIYEDLKCDLTERCPKNCRCLLYPVNATLYVNCSSLNLTSIPKLEEFVLLELDGIVYNKYFVDLRNNDVHEVERNENYTNVTGLSLSNNNLERIRWIPLNLEILELDNNKLDWLNGDVLSLNRKMKRLSIHDNPWRCDCLLLNFTQLIQTDLNFALNESFGIRCKDGRDLLSLTEEKLCESSNHILLSIGIIIMITLPICFIYMKRKRSHLFFEDSAKTYDAFICYSYKDEDFVVEHLVKRLETNLHYKLCIHARDWMVGELIAEQIESSVERSRRTIAVISENFLRSHWGKTELYVANLQSLRDKSHRTIVILLNELNVGEIPDEDWRSSLQKVWCRLNVGSSKFWEDLIEVMPRK